MHTCGGGSSLAHLPYHPLLPHLLHKCALALVGFAPAPIRVEDEATTGGETTTVVQAERQEPAVATDAADQAPAPKERAPAEPPSSCTPDSDVGALTKMPESEEQVSKLDYVIEFEFNFVNQGVIYYTIYVLTGWTRGNLNERPRVYLVVLLVSAAQRGSHRHHQVSGGNLTTHLPRSARRPSSSSGLERSGRRRLTPGKGRRRAQDVDGRHQRIHPSQPRVRANFGDRHR